MTPNTPHEVISFVNTSNELASLLQREIEFVRHKDYKGMETLQNQKYQLTNLYGTKLDAIRNQPGFLDRLDHASRHLLIETTESLNTIAEENTSILESAHASAKRIISILSDVVQKTHSKFKSYGSDGIFGVHVAKTYGQSGNASAFDMRT